MCYESYEISICMAVSIKLPFMECSLVFFIKNFPCWSGASHASSVDAEGSGLKFRIFMSNHNHNLAMHEMNAQTVVVEL